MTHTIASETRSPGRRAVWAWQLDDAERAISALHCDKGDESHTCVLLGTYTLKFTGALLYAGIARLARALTLLHARGVAAGARVRPLPSAGPRPLVPQHTLKGQSTFEDSQ